MMCHRIGLWPMRISGLGMASAETSAIRLPSPPHRMITGVSLASIPFRPLPVARRYSWRGGSRQPRRAGGAPGGRRTQQYTAEDRGLEGMMQDEPYQPMATAPKDGRLIEARSRDRGKRNGAVTVYRACWIDAEDARKLFD